MTELQGKKIPEGWRETTLWEVIETNISSIGKYYNFDQIVYLDTGSITEWKKEALQNFNIIEAPSRAKRLVKENDIIYSTVRPNQKHFWFIEEPQENLVVSTGFTVISTIKWKAEPKFLYYYITQDQITNILQQIAEHSTSTYPSIKPEHIENLDIFLPPLPEQQAIAKILSSFDDKIELLREQNITLEKIWQEIFNEWFGKYRVGGELPEGWRIGKLWEISYEIVRGFTTTYIEKSNLINLNQKVNKWNFLEKQYFKYYPEDTFVPENKFLKNGDILLNSLGEWTLWRVHYFKENSDNIIADQHISILRFKKDLSFYVYQVLISKEWNFRLLNWISGSTWMLMLNINVVRNFEIIIPSEEIIKKYSDFTYSIYEKISINNVEIETLSKIRDGLLPKFMKGEIRVV